MLCLSFFLFFAIITFGQFTVSDAEITLQSRHIWRGSKLGDAPAIEPSITVSKGNFSLNFWAAKTLNKSYSEIDLIPSYQVGEITLSLYDYYVPEIGENNSFVNFRNGENRHTLEFSVDNYSGEKSKFKWMVGTFLTCDKNESTGNPFFSTYLEFKYPFSVLGIDAEPLVGLTPFSGYYADEFAFVNSGLALSKEIKLAKNVVCPLNLTYAYNPYSANHFVTFGFGLALFTEK
jgi:hypothetical protein